MVDTELSPWRCSYRHHRLREGELQVIVQDVDVAAVRGCVHSGHHLPSQVAWLDNVGDFSLSLSLSLSLALFLFSFD